LNNRPAGGRSLGIVSPHRHGHHHHVKHRDNFTLYLPSIHCSKSSFWGAVNGTWLDHIDWIFFSLVAFCNDSYPLTRERRWLKSSKLAPILQYGTGPFCDF
jgi:hypothetical protein